MFDDAERLITVFVKKHSDTNPAAVLSLASYYGRRGRTEEGLQLCDDARATLPAPPVGETAVGVLYAAANPTPVDMARVAGWFEAAAENAQGTQRAALLQLLASVRNLQGDYTAAIALYRQALIANPRDAEAMNNLGFLLSAQEKKHDEALALLADAKKIAGPHPDLLDTEAMIWLNRNDPEVARKLLELVVSEAPSGTSFYHLAQAEMATKRTLEAREVWRKSRDLGLKALDLHPLERKGFEQFANLPELN